MSSSGSIWSRLLSRLVDSNNSRKKDKVKLCLTLNKCRSVLQLWMHASNGIVIKSGNSIDSSSSSSSSAEVLERDLIDCCAAMSLQCSALASKSPKTMIDLDLTGLNGSLGLLSDILVRSVNNRKFSVFLALYLVLPISQWLSEITYMLESLLYDEKGENRELSKASESGVENEWNETSLIIAMTRVLETLENTLESSY